MFGFFRLPTPLGLAVGVGDLQGERVLERVSLLGEAAQRRSQGAGREI